MLIIQSTEFQSTLTTVELLHNEGGGCLTSFRKRAQTWSSFIMQIIATHLLNEQLIEW